MPATPATPNPAGDDRNLVAVDQTTAVTFEDKVQLFWRKNRTLVLAVCVVVLLGIIGRGAWEYFARQREAEIGRAYAAATTPEQLRAFSAANANHALAGIAQLRIADEAYTAGKSAEAIAAYDKAAGVLGSGPLGARARLGRALAKAQAGQGADASKELKQIADDTHQFKAVRAEAAYHLTGLAVEAGDAAEAQKLVDQINQIEPMGIWAQRAMMLRMTLPATPAPAAPEQPAAGAPAAGEKKEEPSVQVKLPGKS